MSPKFLSRTALYAATALPLGGCARGVLDPAGPVAAGNRIILLNSLTIMLAIVIPTILATLLFAWWFRAGNKKAEYKPEFAYSGRLELLVWSVPALIVIFLGGIAWIGSHDLDPSRPLESKVPPLRVQVIALDWKWLFIYPDQGIASVNRVVAPVGTPVAFQITSATVMNSLFVPQLGGQIYAMAGMETKLHLQADRPGSYQGLSAHYSGRGFPGMMFRMDAVSAQQFAGWIAGAKRSGPLLDRAGYLALLKDSENVAPYTYRAVAPGLFDAVVKDSGTLSAKRAKDGRQQ
ncbi:ubiquinol oxidase subunit II [Sphingomonas aliaeris]|uniref:ubiquinol oxidase subunit II n=1 Tax=Sphingomonas aliaeris TaxID=2759526 RepID=UPI001CEDBDAC|nr:ubiquinol oxidase subunit II [Sphingomonas aliaeris]